MTSLTTTTIRTMRRRGRWGPSEQDIRAAIARDAAATVTRCATCPQTHIGTAAEGRYWHEQHRRDEHGWQPTKRRRR